MEPRPASLMAGATAFMPRYTPVQFTAMTASKSSGCVSIEALRLENSRVVHQHVDASRGIEQFGHQGIPGSGIADIQAPVLAAGFLRHGPAFPVAHVGQPHPGAFGGEQPRFHRPLAARGAGDQAHLVLKSSHGFRPPLHSSGFRSAPGSACAPGDNGRINEPAALATTVTLCRAAGNRACKNRCLACSRSPSASAAKSAGCSRYTGASWQTRGRACIPPRFPVRPASGSCS